MNKCYLKYISKFKIHVFLLNCQVKHMDTQERLPIIQVSVILVRTRHVPGSLPNAFKKYHSLILTVIWRKIHVVSNAHIEAQRSGIVYRSHICQMAELQIQSKASASSSSTGPTANVTPLLISTHDHSF